MSDLRFDGRAVIVTGAGRGIGRAYARLLASLGASVVVNDLGGSMGGDGTDSSPAARVVAEIADAGGAAVADSNDVSTAAGAGALVATAVEVFGRVDAVVNNAGIVRWAGFPDVDEDNLARHLAVHVYGAFHTTSAAWPHFVEQGGGRIVTTTSAGVFGLPTNTSYAAAKGAAIGLTRSTAVTGRKLGIKANLIAPAAWTRMAGPGADDDPDPSAGGPMAEAMGPELVAPMVAYLAHDDCPVTGEVYAAGAGRFARIVLAQTAGWVADGEATIDDVAAHWDAINDTTDLTIPRDLNAWSAAFLAHLDLGA